MTHPNTPGGSTDGDDSSWGWLTWTFIVVFVLLLSGALFFLISKKCMKQDYEDF